MPADLLLVVEAWQRLPADLKAAVLAIVRHGRPAGGQR